MTCRHSGNDPSCSKHRSYIAPYVAPEPTTPDASRYEVVDAFQCGSHLVMKVKYPNCSSCAYEGTKVLVFLDKTSLDALKWKKIDPHFRDPKKHAWSHEAPPPDARFPASTQGWVDAIAYADSKTKMKTP